MEKLTFSGEKSFEKSNGTHTGPCIVPQQATQVTNILDSLLYTQVIGVYLYGSATLGGFHPDSDIDILVILKDRMSDSARKSLTGELLQLSGKVGCAAKRPLEVTVLNQKDVLTNQFPPKCEYLYGEWLRAKMEAGEFPQACYRPDILILLWQACKSSIAIKGEAVEKLIPPVSFAKIRRAIALSLPDLMQDLKGDERNVLLTLARMWFTLETEEVTAKDAAADWALPKVPEQLAPVLKMAKEAYLGYAQDTWQTIGDQVTLLADYLQQRIGALLENQLGENE